MVQAFVITLREGLEAFLIVAISLAYLRKSGRRELIPAVHWGIALAVAISVGAAYLFSKAANQALWEGLLAIAAAISVASLTVHMWRTARRIKGDIEGHLHALTLKSGPAAFLGVFGFTLLMITREGMETALLMGTLLFQVKSMSVIAGAIVGTALAAVVASLWSRYGHRVNLAVFFQVTAVFLLVFVVQLLIYGFHELTEANIFPYSEPLHWATEPYGPDGRYGQYLSYLLVMLPMGWLLVSSLTQRRAVPQPSAVPQSSARSGCRISPVTGSLPAPTAPARRRYLDWLRGIAVLIMVEAHAFDAWTRVADRTSAAYGYLILLGGLAAPMFLWLAGLGVVLSAESTLSRTGQRSKATRTVVRRGLEIFLLAFVFRLQAFVVSPGKPLVSLFRVDILNVMGLAIMGAGLVWGLFGRSRATAAACGIAAAVLAMITPVLWAADWVGQLPALIQWYVRPSGANTTFTMFPWAAFVFAGGACGAILARASDERLERKANIALALAGAAVLWLGWYTARLPTVYSASSFWTNSPAYFAIRTGILMLLLGAAYVARPLATLLPAPSEVLEKFGRNSLFVYWIHVEIVYGYATWLIHRRLPLWAGALAYLAFCGGLYWAVLTKEAWELRRKARQNPGLAQPQGAATAV